MRTGKIERGIKNDVGNEVDGWWYFIIIGEIGKEVILLFLKEVNM